MKSIFNLINIGLVLSIFFISCEKDYIDPISRVDPGADAQAPTITITNPSSGTVTIPFTDTKTDMSFQFSASDDIELKNIDISLDGVKLASFATYVDYRKYSGNYLHKDLAIGNHSFSVTATDLAGKATTQTFPFTVTNRYQPVFASEKLYLPFGPNGDFKDIINLVAPSIVGSPSTNATAGRKGAAYQGATDGYISFPLAGLYSSQGISFCFWYKVNASPDRSGIVTINDNANDADDNRMQGLRLFREGSASSQRIKANVGTGTADSWNDGDVIDPSAGQ